jgi:hypothetical protein
MTKTELSKLTRPQLIAEVERLTALHAKGPARARRTEQRHLAAGMCVRCGKQPHALNKTRCADCLLKDRQSYHDRKKTEQSIRQVQPTLDNLTLTQ